LFGKGINDLEPSFNDLFVKFDIIENHDDKERILQKIAEVHINRVKRGKA